MVLRNLKIASIRVVAATPDDLYAVIELAKGSLVLHGAEFSYDGVRYRVKDCDQVPPFPEWKHWRVWARRHPLNITFPKGSGSRSGFVEGIGLCCVVSVQLWP